MAIVDMVLRELGDMIQPTVKVCIGVPLILVAIGIVMILYELIKGIPPDPWQ